VKRWTLHVALLGLLVVLTAGCDWTMFGYNPAHTHYNNTESRLGVGNVANLTTRFVTPNVSLSFDSSPAVANGLVYAGTDNGLYVFDANGVTNCSGTPKTCAPLWRSQDSQTSMSPAVANGIVYLSSESGNLEAFDANGVTNCSGTPKICSPLWTAALGVPSSDSAPTVANGVVYVGIWAFDAKGVTNCSGTPKVCNPLWTISAGGGASSPAVANGIVYFGGGPELDAYDANGVTNCSGTPKVCSPLWSAGSNPTGSPAVANGIVYTDTQTGNGLAAFNAATGAALWQVGVNCVYCDSSPAVANGVVYIGGGITERLYAYNATTGALEWSFRARDYVRSSPSVANGVVYIGTFDSHIYAFDAAGALNCSGSPKTCTPLWSFDTGSSVFSAPAIANGVVYAGGLYAFGLP